jgi:hypothetical protein
MRISSANEGVTKILITTWTNKFLFGTTTESKEGQLSWWLSHYFPYIISLRIGAFTTKMVQPQLKEDKVVNVNFITLGGTPFS